MEQLGLGRSRRGLSQSLRAVGNDLAPHAQRGDHARPVEERSIRPGDRRGVRADRLLAVQRAVRAGHLRRTAAVDERDVESDGSPSARRIRLCRDAVQLHGDRRQSSRGAGDHGQHRDLEARGHRDALGVLCDAAAAGSRVAAGRDQLRAGRSGRDLQHVARAPRSRGRAFPTGSNAIRLQQHVEDDRREHVELRVVSSHRRRDGRQGLHRRAQDSRRSGALGRDRARRVRVPGSEVLGGEPGVRPALALAGSARSHRGDDGRDADGRRARLPQLHGRGDRSEVVHEDQRLSRGREEERDDRERRHREGRRGLLHQADARRSEDPGLSPALRGDLRPGRHGVRVRRRQVGRDAEGGRSDIAVCAHGRRFRE